MLFTESAEGGAGVLRRLQAEPDALALAARTPWRSPLHFDPETGEDVSLADAGRERCEKACYDCRCRSRQPPSTRRSTATWSRPAALDRWRADEFIGL